MNMSEWIEFNKPYKELENLGLANPGTLIEVTCSDYYSDETITKTEQFLIGHINKNRGLCDDCVAFERDAIVNKYKIVWSSQ